jgi:hypothetical protein
MLILNFEGYFQMRMATDPDPADEKRGVSGYTFALVGEPDLDAKIHLQSEEWASNTPNISRHVKRAARLKERSEA